MYDVYKTFVSALEICKTYQDSFKHVDAVYITMDYICIFFVNGQIRIVYK